MHPGYLRVPLRKYTISRARLYSWTVSRTCRVRANERGRPTSSGPRSGLPLIVSRPTDQVRLPSRALRIRPAFREWLRAIEVMATLPLTRPRRPDDPCAALVLAVPRIMS